MLKVSLQFFAHKNIKRALARPRTAATPSRRDWVSRERTVRLCWLAISLSSREGRRSIPATMSAVVLTTPCLLSSTVA